VRRRPSRPSFQKLLYDIQDGQERPAKTDDEEQFWTAARWVREYRYRQAHPMTHWQFEEEPPEVVDLFLAMAHNDAIIQERHRPGPPN
jgi:hypothetical protein